MKAIASVIFLCEVLLAYALECSQLNPSFVPVSSTVQLSNQLPTPIQAIVPSLQFRCQNLITGGNIRVVGASNFDIQVWRPQDNLGNLYNLIWRREFRRRVSIGSSNTDALVNSSFSMSPGVPVRPGDVIGFYSLEPARFLYSFSQQGEIIYTRTSQGPLCNFSINTNTALERRTSALPLISLTYVNATNEEIQLAEQRLPLIGDSCTITTPLDGISTSSIPTSTARTALSTTIPLLSTSDSDREQAATTLSTVSDGISSSDGISGSTTTEDGSNDEQFLSLSLMEFILLVVILAVTVITILIAITVICCCCFYVQRVRSQAEINNTEAAVKDDEMHIHMNANPVYETVRSQTLGLTQTGRDQSLTCTTEPQTTSNCRNQQHQDLVPLAPSDYHVASLIISDVDCIGKHYQAYDRSVHKENLRNCSSNEYSYPNHGAQWIQGHQYQYAADEYVIIQPDQYRQGAHGNYKTETANNNIEKHGSRGILDHTL